MPELIQLLPAQMKFVQKVRSKLNHTTLKKTHDTNKVTIDDAPSAAPTVPSEPFCPLPPRLPSVLGVPDEYVAAGPTKKDYCGQEKPCRPLGTNGGDLPEVTTSPAPSMPLPTLHSNLSSRREDHESGAWMGAQYPGDLPPSLPILPQYFQVPSVAPPPRAGSVPLGAELQRLPGTHGRQPHEYTRYCVPGLPPTFLPPYEGEAPCPPAHTWSSGTTAVATVMKRATAPPVETKRKHFDPASEEILLNLGKPKKTRRIWILQHAFNVFPILLL